MEAFSALLVLFAGNSPVTGELPAQKPLMFSLICAWINSSVNNHKAGDLRRHRAHYGVIVMTAKQNTRNACAVYIYDKTWANYSHLNHQFSDAIWRQEF